MEREKSPLWMPEGSVRAIIALIFALATVGGVLASLHSGDAVSGPLAALLAITTQIVNAYFQDRKVRSQDPRPPVAP